MITETCIRYRLYIVSAETNRISLTKLNFFYSGILCLCWTISDCLEFQLYSWFCALTTSKILPTKQFLRWTRAFGWSSLQPLSGRWHGSVLQKTFGKSIILTFTQNLWCRVFRWKAVVKSQLQSLTVSRSFYEKKWFKENSDLSHQRFHLLFASKITV